MTDKGNDTAKKESSGSWMAASIILMALSCVLFVSTTLAWFTDNVSGGVNTIRAGNLDAVLVIGESELPTKVKLDSDSDTQQTNGENATAVPLKLRKVMTREENGQVVFDQISTDETAQTTPQEAVWNPGDIFISDVMRVEKVNGSIPFEYKLELKIDPSPRTSSTVSSTEESKGTTDDSSAAPEPKANTYIDFRIVDVSTISTVSDGTRTYDYGKIAAYFGSAGGDSEGSAQGETKGSSETPLTPIWPLPSEEESEQSNASGSSKDELSFVIIAKIKSGFTKLPADAESDTIRNPFELIVTLKQQYAAAFEDGGEVS